VVQFPLGTSQPCPIDLLKFAALRAETKASDSLNLLERGLELDKGAGIVVGLTVEELEGGKVRFPLLRVALDDLVETFRNGDAVFLQHDQLLVVRLTTLALPTRRLLEVDRSAYHLH
jgi:hypothetical protein